MSRKFDICLLSHRLNRQIYIDQDFNILIRAFAPHWFTNLVAYNTCSKWAKHSNIKSAIQWKNQHKNGKLPDRFPANPPESYKGKGWVNWYNFLGKIRTPSFDICHRWARDSKIRSSTAWAKAHSSKKLPVGFPIWPHFTFSNKGWKSWPHFFGVTTSNKSGRLSKFAKLTKIRSSITKRTRNLYYTYQTFKKF